MNCPKCGSEMNQIDTVADDSVADAVIYWCKCGHEEKVAELEASRLQREMNALGMNGVTK